MIRRGALGVLAGAALMLGACTPQQPQQVVVVQQPVSQA